MNFSRALTGGTKIVKGDEPGLYHVHTSHVHQPENRNKTIFASLREVSDKKFFTEKLKTALAAAVGIDIEKDITMFDRTENRIVITLSQLQKAQELVRKGPIYLKDSGRIKFFLNEPKKWVMTLMKVPGHIEAEDMREMLGIFGTVHRLYRKYVYMSKDSSIKLPGPNIIVQYTELRKLPPHRIILDQNTTIEAIWTLPSKDMVAADNQNDFLKEWEDLPQEIRNKHSRNTAQKNPIVTTSKTTEENELNNSKQINQPTSQDTSVKTITTSTSNKNTSNAKDNTTTSLKNASAEDNETLNTETIKITTIPPPSTSKWSSFQTTDETEEEPTQAFRTTHHEIVNTQQLPPTRTFPAPTNVDGDFENSNSENTVPPKNTNIETDTITNITNDMDTETIEVIETSQDVEDCELENTTRKKRNAHESPTREGFRKVQKPKKKKKNKGPPFRHRITPYKESIYLDDKDKIKICEQTNTYKCLGSIKWILSSGSNLQLWKSIIDLVAMDKGITFDNLPKIDGYPGEQIDPGIRCSKVRDLKTQFQILINEQGKPLAPETMNFVVQNFDLFIHDN